MDKALVILSGGQDSTTCLFWAKEKFDEVHAVTFDYGQRHKIEIEAARKVAEMAGVASHEVVVLGDHILHSTSPLVGADPLEQYEGPEQMEAIIGNRVEKTFVPMRNALFFTIAANRAVELGCMNLVTGVCEADNANYPDCTGAFVNSFEIMLNQSLGLAMDSTWLRLHAPLLDYSKSESIHLACTLDGCYDALAYSHTSYDGKYPPTDMNHANVLRADGFAKANMPDPLVLRAWREGLMELPMTANYNWERLGASGK